MTPLVRGPVAIGVHAAAALLALAGVFPQEPKAASPSEEAKAALARAKVPGGYQLSLFASEPRVANPVGFWIDRTGVMYVAETHRLHEGTTDIRDHMDWCDDDLASRSVEDRVALLRKHLGEKVDDYTRARDLVRWVADTDGDGVADADRVLDDDYHGIATGVGAAVLSHEGSVYYTNIPDLWRLGDPGRDGHLAGREALASGFGVHITMIGHDLHGLRIGLDGRLYFSCGDRAFNVLTREGTRLEHTHTGGVLRCELDGSNLEVFASGLRNPQDLVFDEHGDLFTGDNNCDGGDRARWVHVVEGSDSGYRYGYQWMQEPYLRGPWNDEKLWHPAHAGQAAYVLPPVSWLGAGPSGVAHDPGTGLAPEDRGKFYVCDFEGDPGSSSVLRFPLKRKGASFEIGPVERFLAGALPTDVEFGPDGALYWTDWVQGWGMTGKGRIARIAHPAAAADPRVAETRRILGEGWAGRPAAELEAMLSHADQRVRLGAELELAGRGAEGRAALERAADAGPTLLARLHGLFGVSIAARRGAEVSRTQLSRWLADPEEEVRARAAWLAGETRAREFGGALAEKLRDPSARVRLQAAIALAKTEPPGAVDSLLALIAETGEADRALRHAATLALAACADGPRLAALAKDGNADVRVGAVVALRRKRDPLVAAFLGDVDPRVAAEAARAVYDVPIAPALPELAARLPDAPAAGEPLARRALAAAFRLGGRANARAIAAYAARAEAPERLRLVALDHLARYADTPGRDPICGEWRPFPRSEAEKRAIGEDLPAVVASLAAPVEKAPEAVAEAWLRLVETWKVSAEVDRVARWSTDRERPPALRARALCALEALAPPDLGSRLRAALADASAEVRVAALEALRRAAPEETLPAAKQALEGTSAAELRFAYDALRSLATTEADLILREQVARLEAGLVPAEARLELLAAARARFEDQLSALLPSLAAAAERDPDLAPYLDVLDGGDAKRGRALFRNHASLGCLRCHRGDDGEGGLVGPDLRGLSKRATRLHVLESIVAPNRKVANGYQGIALELKKGGIVAGRVEREEGGKIHLRKSDDTVVVIEAADVADRFPDVSAMPEGLPKFVSKEELRDLVEYLAGIP